MKIDQATFKYKAHRYCERKCKCTENECTMCRWDCPVIGFINYLFEDEQ